LSALARLPGPIRELGGAENLLPEIQTGHGSSREFMKLMNWLTAHDVEAIVSPALTAHNPPYYINTMSLSARSIYHTRKRRSSRKNTRGQQPWPPYHTCTWKGDSDSLTELRHRCRAPSISSIYNTRVITNTNGRFGRGKLRAHHRGSPPRVSPIATRIRRAIITTPPLCRMRQQGRSPRGTPQPSRFCDAVAL
jgi:hypothetical protein